MKSWLPLENSQEVVMQLNPSCKLCSDRHWFVCMSIRPLALGLGDGLATWEHRFHVTDKHYYIAILSS